ncbi:PREDICTED: protein FAR1-RELATED SEQUENCE 5-like [Ipomoea nil]|uniref:protein FAR1-RELATED SEQUENCE 5-like n=1 Tax=Ipomoea nil TaxID=35883 RepID=UPI000900BAED|nr:PREDICTED: protein FAR1-RELATED SEQUENCE 5-like [Ipomoea nil]
MEDGTEQSNSAVGAGHSIQGVLHLAIVFAFAPFAFLYDFVIHFSEGIVDGSVSSDQADVDNDGSSSIPVDQDLVGLVVSNVDEAFELYNNYAYRLGFSVRKGHQRYKGSTKTIQMKNFCCSKSGYKANSGVKAYSKIDTRTGCEAFVQFDVGDDGLWTVTKHEKVHNHELCVFNKSHLLRSHRSVGDNQLLYLQGLKDSGVALADGIRFLKHQSGGSPLVSFTSRDVYNSMAADIVKRLDGTDSNSLIEIFRRRQSTESDFFFDFELDLDARLCSFFWRDGQMRRDYEMFGDFLVYDTTYRTNKYDMIYGPFVGMNHHCMNVMFGCGFLMNERIESFVWLFKVFLRSMGGKYPQSIMTYQCAVMAAAISKVFPTSRHRLCIWHIGNACHQEMVLNDGHQQKYHVWRPDIDITSIPDKYVLKRWTKKVIDGRNVNIDSIVYNVGIPPSIWVFDISRKFQRLVVSSHDSSVARKLCDEAVDDVKKKVEAEIGYVHIEECGVSSSSGSVQNPSSRRLKGERNKRRSGVIEKKYSLARGRRSAANQAALSTKGAVQSLVLEDISKLAGDGYLVHPSSSSSDFVQFSKGLDDNVGVD